MGFGNLEISGSLQTSEIASNVFLKVPKFHQFLLKVFFVILKNSEPSLFLSLFL